MKRRRISKRTFSALLVLIVWTTIILTHVIVILGTAHAGTSHYSARPGTSFAEPPATHSASNRQRAPERLDLNHTGADPNASPAPEKAVTQPSTSPAI